MSRGTLRYRQGPGFLVIEDRRHGLGPARYTLSEVEAAIYLACDDGRSIARILRTVDADGSLGLGEEEVRRFLDELAGLRLVYEEDGKFLSLALPV